MALVMVDTCVLIDHLRGHPGAAACLRDAAQRGDELWAVSVVRTELLAGVRAGEEEQVQAFLGALRWLDVTVELADAAGTLAARYLRSHPGVDTVDYIIAAGALALDARLLTQNVRHFPMLPGLAAAYV
mgnify:CR=1 FL=1